MIIGWFFSAEIAHLYEKMNFIDIDTAYNRIWIYDQTDAKTNRPIRIMGINNENHSSMFLDGDELVNQYSEYYLFAGHFYPELKSALIIGGAGYSLPKAFLETYPKAAIDVVEIDPMVTELAKKYFRLQEDKRLRIFHEDGRVYLNKAEKKYDVIFGDAFGAYYSLPYQLTTKEAVQKKYDILSDNGLVILNIVSSIEGKKGMFLRAEYATYKSIFPQVYVFPVAFPDNGSIAQNIILLAFKSNEPHAFESSIPKINELLRHLWKKEIEADIPILTDDFAPVDYYTSKII
jgi:spermidine synthase